MIIMSQSGDKMFVDWYYWNSLAPDDCPKRKEMEQEDINDDA